jgi:putative acetyltransferase
VTEPLVREARADDPVADVITAAFGEEGPRNAELWTELAGSDLLRVSLVAAIEGEVVGHVGLSHAWLDARRKLVDVWVLSPLSVAPEHQRRGVGTFLVAAALDAARVAGAPLLFLEGDPGYYGTRGFEPADGIGCTPASVRTPAPAFQVVRFGGYQEWMTGQLVYPDIWWRYDAVGLRDPMLAEIEKELR